MAIKSGHAYEGQVRKERGGGTPPQRRPTKSRCHTRAKAHLCLLFFLSLLLTILCCPAFARSRVLSHDFPAHSRGVEGERAPLGAATLGRAWRRGWSQTRSRGRGRILRTHGARDRARNRHASWSERSDLRREAPQRELRDRLPSLPARASAPSRRPSRLGARRRHHHDAGESATHAHASKKKWSARRGSEELETQRSSHARVCDACRIIPTLPLK